MKCVGGGGGGGGGGGTCERACVCVFSNPEFTSYTVVDGHTKQRMCVYTIIWSVI